MNHYMLSILLHPKTALKILWSNIKNGLDRENVLSRMSIVWGSEARRGRLFGTHWHKSVIYQELKKCVTVFSFYMFDGSGKYECVITTHITVCKHAFKMSGN